MSTRAPWFDFTFNKFLLDDMNLRPLISKVTFKEAIGKFDTVEIVINSAEELGYVPEITKLGSALQLSGGYYNEGVLPMTICFLHAYKPDFAQRTVTLSFMGYLKAMDKDEKDRTVANKSIREIVELVIADYDTLEVGNIDAGDTIISKTNTQSKTTDFKLLEGLASDFGMHWKIEAIPGVAGKWYISLYKMKYDKTKTKDYLPLTIYPEKEYQSERRSIPLKSFAPKANVLGVSSRVEIRSNNPDQPIVVETELKDPLENPSEVTGSEVVATIFGSSTTVHFYENVSNEEAAAIIAEQLRQSDELSFVVADGSQCREGIPNLRLGQTREIICRGIPMFDKMFSGAYFITATTHEWADTTGYDTTFSANRNALSIPIPEASGFGGGSGVAVLIRVYQDGTSEGWYVNFDANGVVSLGQHISHEEIIANDYWMEHVNPSLRFYNTNLQTPTSGTTMTTGGSEEADWTNMTRWPMFEGPYVDIRIDWPENWNTGSTYVATPVAETSIPAIEVAIWDTFGLGQIPTNVFEQDRERQEELIGQHANFLEGLANQARDNGGGS